MERPTSHPGPRDGSSPMVWPVAGVIVSIVIYLIALALPGVHNGDNILYFIVPGALAGFAVYLFRRRVRR